MLSACPTPMSSRRNTMMAKPPPAVTQRPPVSSTRGPIHSARRRLRVRNNPRGMSATIRANPKAPATIPSCQSARAALRAMSGRTAGKAPLETMLEKVVRQSRAVRDVTRPFMVNHCPMTEATIRLDVQGEVARMTFDRPHVLNAGNSRFATELGEAVATIGARPDVLAVGELTQPDLIRWEDAMTAIERMDKLVVAAINGHCIGGGLQLALVCDYRLAVEDALLSLPAVKECLIPSMALYRLPRLIGLG